MDLSGRPLSSTGRDAELYVGFRPQELRVLEAVGARLNVLVLAPRGGGKTSFLHHLSREMAGPAGWDPIYVDGRRVDSTVDLLLDVWRSVTGRSSVLRADDRFAALDAAEVLTQLRRDVAGRPDSAPKLVVLLDGTPTPEVVHTIFGKLRDEIWGIEVTWVVAGDTENRAMYLTPPADAFFGAVVDLPPLTDEEAIELLRHRVTGPPRTLKRLVAASDRTPRSLIQLAGDVFVNGLDLDQVEERQKQLETAIERLGRPAAMLVAEMTALGPVAAGDERILTSLGWSRPRVVQVLHQLEGEGLVESGMSQIAGGRPKKLYWLRSVGMTP
jgi:hypothetical protein